MLLQFILATSFLLLNIMKSEKNRAVLFKILNFIKFCGKYEWPLGGHNETLTSKNQGVFWGFIDFACEFDSSLQAHFNSKKLYKKFKNHTKRYFGLSSGNTDAEIVQEIQVASFLTVLRNETTDIADENQIVVILRYVGGK